MPLNLDAVGRTAGPAEVSWSSKDALLYALGVGAGQDDPLRELEFTTENSHGVTQQVLPTFGVIVVSRGGARLALPRRGRPPPAPPRPGLRGGGRLPPPHPARPVHVRRDRPAAAARAVRLRPGPLPLDAGPVLASGAARRPTDGLDVGGREL